MRLWTLAMLVPLALATLACGDDDAPGSAEVDGYEVRVPAGWTARYHTDGPRRMLTLRDEDRTMFCQIITLRDGRIFRDDDAVAFLGDGKRHFEISVDEPVELTTPEGVLPGLAARDAVIPRSWGLAALSGDSLMEMYAVPRGRRLVSAIAATFAGAPEAEANMQRCRNAIESMEVP